MLGLSERETLKTQSSMRTKRPTDTHWIEQNQDWMLLCSVRVCVLLLSERSCYSDPSSRSYLELFRYYIKHESLMVRQCAAVWGMQSWTDVTQAILFWLSLSANTHHFLCLGLKSAQWHKTIIWQRFWVWGGSLLYVILSHCTKKKHRTGRDQCSTSPSDRFIKTITPMYWCHQGYLC